MLNTYRAWGLDCTLGSECRFIVVFSFKLLAMQAQSHCLGYDFKGLRMQEQNRAWGMPKLLLHWDTSLAGITNPRANGIAIRAQNGKIGLGSVTIRQDREKWAQFSQPYLKNIAVLASALDVNSLQDLTGFPTVFEGKVALVVKGSSHEKELLQIKEKYYPEMRVSYASNPKEMLIKMKSEPKYFGYVDIITYMAFTEEQGGILRVHRAADIQGELFGFVFPPNSDWNTIFNEFMVGGFGFTATDEYHAILEKYLELNVIQEVQLR